MSEKSSISPEDFVLHAITVNKEKGYKGLHSVWSGFNAAFRQHFGAAEDPIATTTQMRKSEKIAVFPAKGGVLLYLRADVSASRLRQHDADWKERDAGGGKKSSEPKKKGPDTAGDLLSKILNKS